MFYMLLGTFHIKDVTRYIRDHPYSSVCIGTVSLKGNTYKIPGGGTYLCAWLPNITLEHFSFMDALTRHADQW